MPNRNYGKYSANYGSSWQSTGGRDRSGDYRQTPQHAYSNRGGSDLNNRGNKGKINPSVEELSNFLKNFSCVSRTAAMKDFKASNITPKKISDEFGTPQKKIHQYGHIAFMRIRDPAGGEVTCLGFSTKKKAASFLALYHVHLTLKSFKERSLNASEGGISPPAAPQSIPPLILGEERDRLLGILPTMLQEEDNGAEVSSGVISSAQLDRNRSMYQEQLQYYLQEKVPPVGDHIFDRTSELVMQYNNEPVKTTIDKYNALVKNPRRPSRITLKGTYSSSSSSLSSLPGGSQRRALSPVRQVAAQVFLAHMKVPGDFKFPAVGVSNNAKLARQRCYAHAILMLRLSRILKTDNVPDGTCPLDLSDAPQHLAHLAAFYLTVVRPQVKVTTPSLEERNDDYSTQSCGRDFEPNNSPQYSSYVSAPTSYNNNNNTNSNNNSSKTDGVAVTITVGAISESGTGINEIEAYKMAIGKCLNAMYNRDKLFSSLVRTANKFPNIEVSEKSPKVRFSSEMISRISKEYRALPTTSAKVLLAPKHKASVGLLSEEEQTRVNELSKQMSAEHQALLQNPYYRERIEPGRSRLPIAKYREEILRTVRDNQVTIVSGSTGSGKTTQVPQFILDAAINGGKAASCNICVTQPRRISAVSIAERIASERMENVGETCGYSIRLENKAGKNITLVTTGVLLAQLVVDPKIENVTHLVIDECHERQMDGDVVLSLVKKLCSERPDLRVILMSATMQTDLFSNYFNGAPVIEVEGTLFPIQSMMMEDFENDISRNCHDPRSTADLRALREYYELVRRNRNSPSKIRVDVSAVAVAVRRAIQLERVSNREQAILVFLPGWGDITGTEDALTRDSPNAYEIVKLHSTLAMSAQKRAFEPAPKDKTKVILATNIAESGITVDGITCVIDTGMNYLTFWTTQTSDFFVTELRRVFAANASLMQRRGRAGRTQNGRYICMLPRDVANSVPRFHTPEICRVPLSTVMLRLLGMGVTDPVAHMSTIIEPPPMQHVQESYRQLIALGAITLSSVNSPSSNSSPTKQYDSRGPYSTMNKSSGCEYRPAEPEAQLTFIGYILAKIPVDVMRGRILLSSFILGCLESGMTVVATTEMDPFVTNRLVRQQVQAAKKAFALGTYSDQLAMVNAVHAYIVNPSVAEKYMLDKNSLSRILQYRQQYRNVFSHLFGIKDESADLTRAAAIQGAVSPLFEAGSDSSFSPERATAINNDDDDFDENDALRAGLKKPFSGEFEENGISQSAKPSPIFSPNLIRNSSPGNQGCLPCSKDAFRVPFLRAAIASGYFSRIALSHRDSRHISTQGKNTASAAFFRTKTRNNIALSNWSAIDPKSRFLPHPFYITYESIFVPPSGMSTKKKDLFTNPTFITILELVLVAAPISSFQYFPEVHLCLCDEWIAFGISPESFNALIQLKTAIEIRMWEKLERPHDLNVDQKFCRVVKLLQELLLNSEMTSQNGAENDDEGNDDFDDDAEDDDDGDDAGDDEGLGLDDEGGGTERDDGTQGSGNAQRKNLKDSEIFSETVIDFNTESAQEIDKRIKKSISDIRSFEDD